MREIDVSIIEKTVEELFISANAELPSSLENLIKVSKDTETNETAKNIFCDMCKNLEVARENEIPICQDTGMAVLFIEVGQDVHFVGGSLNDAINNGVKKAYFDGIDGIIINPAAYTHTSVAILDALKATAIPTVEVHISDVDSREEFRKTSYVRLYALTCISGRGFEGYTDAAAYLMNYLSK
jgi:3-dehydroquinate dehydratase